MAKEEHTQTILIAASGFIYGPTSSNNLGDRAQLTRTVERLRDAFPESRLLAVANSLNDVSDLEDLDVSYNVIRYLTSPVVVPSVGARALAERLEPCASSLSSPTVAPLHVEGRTGFRSALERDAVADLAGASALFLSGAGTFNDLYITGVGGFWSVLATCMAQLGKPVVASGQAGSGHSIDPPGARRAVRSCVRSTSSARATRDHCSARASSVFGEIASC